MAKTQSKKTKVKAEPPIDQNGVDEGWGEIGDFWDEIFLFEKAGDVFEGVYIRTSDNIGPNESKVHVFQVGQERVGVWGSSALDTRMATAKAGFMTRVRFESLAIAQKSGREYRDFKVFQRKEPAPGFSDMGEDIPF